MSKKSLSSLIFFTYSSFASYLLSILPDNISSINSFAFFKLIFLLLFLVKTTFKPGLELILSIASSNLYGYSNQSKFTSFSSYLSNNDIIPYFIKLSCIFNYFFHRFFIFVSEFRTWSIRIKFFF